MLDWLWGLATDALRRVASWLLDLFVWLWELVYALWNEFLSWIGGLVSDILFSALEAVAGFVPKDVIDVIAASYEWLEYINEWVPIKYGIGLLTAYYSIWVVLFVFRKVRGLIFGFGG